MGRSTLVSARSFNQFGIIEVKKSRNPSSLERWPNMGIGFMGSSFNIFVVYLVEEQQGVVSTWGSLDLRSG